MQVGPIITLALDQLGDSAGRRWSRERLRRYAGVSARQIAEVRPDAAAVTEQVALVAGAEQGVPESMTAFMGAVRNVGGPTINNVDGAAFDAMVPDWRDHNEDDLITDCIYRASQPRVFEVYPPAIAGTEIVIRGVPRITDPADDDADMPLIGSMETALLHVILAYAYAENTGTAATRGLAAQHLELATNLIGGEAAARLSMPPIEKATE